MLRSTIIKLVSLSYISEPYYISNKIAMKAYIQKKSFLTLLPTYFVEHSFFVRCDLD